MLTIKSDDVVGRSKAYEAIVKGEVLQKPSLPESFNVLLHELRGLGLDVELFDEEDQEVEFSIEEEHVDASAEIPEEDKVSELNDLTHETDEEVEAEVQGDIPPEQEGEL